MASTPEEVAAVKDLLSSVGEDVSTVNAANALSRLLAHDKRLKTRHAASEGVMSLSADDDPDAVQPDLLAEARRVLHINERPALALADELSGGRWVTVHGKHVYIKDGRVVVGALRLAGKGQAPPAPNAQFTNETFNKLLEQLGAPDPDDRKAAMKALRDTLDDPRYTNALGAALATVGKMKDEELPSNLNPEVRERARRLVPTQFAKVAIPDTVALGENGRGKVTFTNPIHLDHETGTDISIYDQNKKAR